MWIWQRMLRIPWTARRTNISIVNEIQEPVRLRILYERRFPGYFGHVTKREVGNLEKDISLGKVQGKRSNGRSPTRWSDIIKARMGSLIRAASQVQDNMVVSDGDLLMVIQREMKSVGVGRRMTMKFSLPQFPFIYLTLRSLNGGRKGLKIII